MRSYTPTRTSVKNYTAPLHLPNLVGRSTSRSPTEEHLQPFQPPDHSRHHDTTLEYDITCDEPALPLELKAPVHQEIDQV